MSLDVDVSITDAAVPVSRKRLADLALETLRTERVRHALISIAFVGRRRIAALNRHHLGRRGPTDVIAFGFSRPTRRDPVVGDIYIAPEIARDNARARRIPVREELARLVVHGVLHVVGHDHPDDDSREQSPMWARQERLVRRFVERAQ
jgi:probable rRNA maturation factor